MSRLRGTLAALAVGVAGFAAAVVATLPVSARGDARAAAPRAGGSVVPLRPLAPARLAVRPLRCSDGRERVVADPALASQALTFATAQDCLTSSVPHLDWVRRRIERGDLDVDHFFVVFAPPPDQPAVRRVFEPLTRDPVCWDETGSYWRDGGLGRTPVTVTLQRGQVTSTSRRG